MSEKFRKIGQMDGVYVGLLLVITVLAYAGFLAHPCIHDFYNEFFPQRYFHIDCLRNHLSPLWNPYQMMGTPAHADPQTGVFYIPARIFAIFGPYHSIWCAIEFMMHVFVGGWGLYCLCRHFNVSRPAAFVGAFAYLMSGFFVGNAQHLSWIVAGAWLPWLMYSTLQLLRTPGWRPAVCTAIFASLMFTGGYPGFSFGYVYIVAALFVAMAFHDVKNKRSRHFRDICLFGALAVLLFIVLALPTIISFVEVKPWITRGQSLDYTQISNDFPSLSSLLFPYTIMTEPSIMSSDITMRSLYVGVFTLALFVVGLCQNRSRMLWLLLGLGVLSLLFAYGRVLPFHRCAFYTLPLVQLMRIPTLMRIFFIITMLLFAAVGFDAIAKREEKDRNILTITLLIVAAVSLAVLVMVSLPVSQNWESDIFPPTFFHKLKMEAVVTFAISLLSLLIIRFLKCRQTRCLLLVILLTDMILHVVAIAPYTVYNQELRHQDLARITQPRAQTVPQRLSNASAIQDPEPHLLWKNAGSFFKQVEWESYNPFMLSNFDKMQQPYFENGQERNMDLPIVFFPKTVVFDTVAHLLNEDTAYVEQQDREGVYPDSTSSATIVQFDPGYIVLKTSVKESRPLVLAQNFYPGWHCDADGRALEIHRINSSMMSVLVPQGTQNLVFTYRKPFISAAWTLEWLTFLVLLLLCVVAREKGVGNRQ